MRQAVCASQNQIRFPLDHFESYLGIALNVSLSGVPHNDKVFALDIAKPLQLFEECSDPRKSLHFSDRKSRESNGKAIDLR